MEVEDEEEGEGEGHSQLHGHGPRRKVDSFMELGRSAGGKEGFRLNVFVPEKGTQIG